MKQQMNSKSQPESDQGTPQPESDGQPRWRRTLYAVWLAQLIVVIGFGFVAPFLPFYVRELGITDERQLRIWAGLLIFAPGLMFTIFAPLWGIVADRYGRKLMLARAVFAGAGLLTLMGRVSNAYQLLGLRFLQGALTGSMSAAMALVSSTAPTARLGYSMGLMQTSIFVGFAIGPLVGGLSADYLGYRESFYIAGGLLFIAGLVVVFGVKENFARPTAEMVKANGDLGSVVRNPGFPAVLAILFLVNMGGTIAWPIFPLFVESLGVPGGRVASATGIILFVSGIAAAVSATVMGRVSDKRGPRPILILSTLFSGIFSIPHALVRSVTQLLGVRALFGLAAGGTGPSVNAIVGRMVPRDSYGRAYGITSAAAWLGATVGPLVGGFTASALGLRAPFVIMGVVLIIVSGVVAAVIKEGENARTS